MRAGETLPIDDGNTAIPAETFSIPVVIPAYEPDGKLTRLIRELKEAGFGNLIIVDDGSSPSCGELFREAEQDYACAVMHHNQNQGKGRALKTAFSFCLETFPDAPGCITADADGQHSPECILKIAKAMIETPDALVLGVRDFDRENVPKKSEYGNKITRNVMRFLAGVSVTDTQTGLRGIPASFMKDLLDVKGERYEFETNMLLETNPRNVPIREVPIRTIYIDGNSSSHFNPWKDSLRIYLMFGKFLLSSLSSSVLDLALFALFCHLLRDNTRALPGILSRFSYIGIATAVGRVISSLYNYIINHCIVFDSKASAAKTLPRYVLLAAVQMCMSWLLVEWIHGLTGGLELFVKIPVDLSLFFLSFFIQREIVYK
ncbi:MAG: bifunctional glycosyltransferase family 2/GtrA family protein [Lachnospiraceae bacterium]|nr:bifunctional glycosyltransferase family 2/GtrA family protein [Lachnospiraceae bacterium]